MVAQKHEFSAEAQKIMSVLTPDNQRAFMDQYSRYVRIQEAQGLKDEIGAIGYLNTVLILGFGVSAMKLIENENRLGI
jgi:hypothetical protein